MSNKQRNIPRTILSVVIGCIVLAIGWFGLQYMGGLKEDPPKKEVSKRIKTVEATPVYNSVVSTNLAVQGRLEAYNKIELFCEAGGLITTPKPFKKGTYFKKGDVMLQVDDTQTRLNIQAQKATLLNGIAAIMPDLKIDYPESFPAWERYLSAFSLDDPITAMPAPANQREKLFIAGRNLQSQYYNIKSQEKLLSNFTLYAPFSGVLTSANINNGAVIRPGQQLGELMATGYYEMFATVPLSQLNFLKPGGTVKLYSEDIEGEWTGKVKRISDQIDPQTQTVGVYVGVSGRDLREGMYLRGEAAAKALNNVVEIDRDLLIDEQEVYAVKNDTLLVLLPVTVQKFNRETVIVSGLPDGAQLLTSDVAGAYDGMRVQLKGTETKRNTAAETTTEDKVPVSK